MPRNKLRELIVTRIQAGESKSKIDRDMGVHINTVKYARNVYQERGTTDNARRPGQPIQEKRRSIKDAVAGTIERDPNVSLRALSRDFDVPLSTMKRLVNQDLGLKSLVKVKAQQLTPLQHVKRLTQCKVMLNRLKGPDAGKILVFPMKKTFILSSTTIAGTAAQLLPMPKLLSQVTGSKEGPNFRKRPCSLDLLGVMGQPFREFGLKAILTGPGTGHSLRTRSFPS